MPVPQHLEHKPIIAVDNYDTIDGKYANNSDAKALSIGQAQYDEDEIAVKVFRKPNQRWSRQSEELPIHRNLDLTILIIKTMVAKENPQKKKSNLNEVAVNPGRVKEIEVFYNKNKKYLKPRLEEIKELLDLYLK